MKATILYYSKSGHTQAMAARIAEGMRTEGVEVKACAIDAVDEDWLRESRCVLLGTPTYYADISASMKVFMEQMGKYRLSGKLGGAFASADYVHGGGETAIQTMLTHMMCLGMLIYSGGGAFGAPVIHLGPVCITGLEQMLDETFLLYGQRMAAKALELFGA